MVQYDTSRQDSHSLSRKPKVGDVSTNSLRVRVVAEPEALVQLLDLRVRRNLHGRPLQASEASGKWLTDTEAETTHKRRLEKAGYGVDPKGRTSK